MTTTADWQKRRLTMECTQYDKFLPWLPFKEVQIGFGDSGKLIVSPFALNHLECLDNVIENVTISSWNFEKNKNAKLTNLTNFMLKKCSPNLRKICIVGDIELVQLGEKIASILGNVNSVEFRNRRGPVDEAQFLTHCPKLRKIILGTEINNENVDAILQQHYPRLTHFYYLHGDGRNLNAEKLQEFFGTNQKLNYVAWKLRTFDNNARNHFVKCIDTIDHAKDLQNFRLCFGDQLPKHKQEDFDDICHQLDLLCKRKTFKYLEIELTDPEFSSNDDQLAVVSRMNRFASWKQLTKIHLHHFWLLITIPAIIKLVHLKRIVLENCCWIKKKREGEIDARRKRQRHMKLPSEESIDESVLFEVMDDNPAMEVPQIRVVEMINERHHDLTELCMPLVRYWKNLKKIVAPVANYGINIDIAELSRAREKLTRACDLIIMTNHKSLPTDQQHGLVQLKCSIATLV